MLSKSKLVSAISSELPGYVLLPAPSSGAAALFSKFVDDLVLTLGIERSTRYEGRFTGSFYLSRSCSWSYVPGWLPKLAYSRIGHFLDEEARQILLEPEFAKPGVHDAWWWADQKGVQNFGVAIGVGEHPFVSQAGLAEQLRTSKPLDEYVRKLDSIIEHARAKGLTLQASSKEWLRVAEDILAATTDREALKPNFVKLLAADAQRLHLLRSSHNGRK